ncbi:hypothetical protein ACA910_017693 [Epithemia clementina (nom. ined.)]
MARRTSLPSRAATTRPSSHDSRRSIGGRSTISTISSPPPATTVDEETLEQARQRRAEQAEKRRLAKLRAEDMRKGEVKPIAAYMPGSNLARTSPASTTSTATRSATRRTPTPRTSNTRLEQYDEEDDETQDGDAVMEDNLIFYDTNAPASPAYMQPRIHVVGGAGAATTASSVTMPSQYRQHVEHDLTVMSIQQERERKVQLVHKESAWSVMACTLRQRAEQMENLLSELNDASVSRTTQEKLNILSRESSILCQEFMALAQQSHSLSE